MVNWASDCCCGGCWLFANIRADGRYELADTSISVGSRNTPEDQLVPTRFALQLMETSIKASGPRSTFLRETLVG